MKLNKKKKSMLFLAIAVCVSTTVGIVAMANSKKNDVIDNRLNIATLRGDIEEKDFKEKEDIQIGETKSKEVSVKNTGNLNLFVRVMAFPQIEVPQKDSEGNDSPTLLEANIGKEIEVVIGTDWIDGEDGYYYYTGKVEPGKATTPLFSEVKLSDSVADTYKGAALEMQIKSETVPAANFQYRKAWWDKDVDAVPAEVKQAEIDSKLAAIVEGG